MKKIISQISIILLIILIGTTFSVLNKTFAATSLNCSSTVNLGENIVISLTGFPSNKSGYSANLTIKYADGTIAAGTLVQSDIFAGDTQKETCVFVAKVAGKATIECEYYVTDVNAVVIDTGTITKEVTIKEPCKHETTTTEVVQNLSCTKDKIVVIKCSKCGVQIEKKTTEKAKGHVFGETKTVKEPTCCNSGSAEKTCTASGCTAKETMTLDATGKHTYKDGCKLTKNTVNNTANTNKNTSKNTTNTVDEVKNPTFKDVDEKVYATKKCNVRSSCSTATNNNKLGSLQKDEQVTRTGTSKEWSRIIYNGKVAYVAAEFLTTEEPVDENEVNNTANENVVDDEMAAIQRQVGVLPEVGNNIAVTLYFVVTACTVAIVSGSLYFINKK